MAEAHLWSQPCPFVDTPGCTAKTFERPAIQHFLNLKQEQAHNDWLFCIFSINSRVWWYNSFFFKHFSSCYLEKVHKADTHLQLTRKLFGVYIINLDYEKLKRRSILEAADCTFLDSCWSTLPYGSVAILCVEVLLHIVLFEWAPNLYIE